MNISSLIIYSNTTQLFKSLYNSKIFIINNNIKVVGNSYYSQQLFFNTTYSSVSITHSNIITNSSSSNVSILSFIAESSVTFDNNFIIFNSNSTYGSIIINMLSSSFYSSSTIINNSSVNTTISGSILCLFSYSSNFQLYNITLSALLIS